jgi:AraC-like DNA-binding protein
MHSSGEFLSTPNLDFEAWRDVVRSICGRYTPSGIEPKSFSGRARVRSICRFRAVDLSSNAYRLERTHQDVHVDARDHYYAIFQMTGQSRIIQNDRTVRLDHSARLLKRRSFLITSEPISEIAYFSGFGDYTNFIRQFRRRFGHTPGSHSGDHAEPGCISTTEGASLAHDV